MSIYYQDDLVTLYHGDCLTQTAWLDADVLCTDPPYGIGYQGFGGRKGEPRRTEGRISIAGDDTTGVRDAALHAWGNRPALIFGTWRAERPRDARTLLIWDKGLVGMGHSTFPGGRRTKKSTSWEPVSSANEARASSTSRASPPMTPSVSVIPLPSLSPSWRP